MPFNHFLSLFFYLLHTLDLMCVIFFKYEWSLEYLKVRHWIKDQQLGCRIQSLCTDELQSHIFSGKSNWGGKFNAQFWCYFMRLVFLKKKNNLLMSSLNKMKKERLKQSWLLFWETGQHMCSACRVDKSLIPLVVTQVLNCVPYPPIYYPSSTLPFFHLNTYAFFVFQLYLLTSLLSQTPCVWPWDSLLDIEFAHWFNESPHSITTVFI